ncbi:hypothetical protein G6F56_011609 [Rhizopus delemar]|nr:hypothetical protein G6F56_011609 [Rhizopus delemar]
MVQEPLGLTEVFERQNTLSEDVRNLLNYTQAQQPDIQVSSENECNNSLSRRIIPTDVPRTPKEFKEQKKRPKDEEKIRAYLKELVEEKEKNNNRSSRVKRQLVHMFQRNITTMANHQCLHLYNDIQKDSTIVNKDVYWKDVPKEIRSRHIKILEHSTERIGMRISECEGHWVAEALFRRQYEHHFNPKKEKQPAATTATTATSTSAATSNTKAVNK